MSGGEFRQKVKFKIAFLTGGRIDVWILNYNDKGKLKDAIFSLSGDFFLECFTAHRTVTFEASLPLY